MPLVRLTARFLETLKPTGGRVDYFDADERDDLEAWLTSQEGWEFELRITDALE
jgi:hypothetical protein